MAYVARQGPGLEAVKHLCLTSLGLRNGGQLTVSFERSWRRELLPWSLTHTTGTDWTKFGSRVAPSGLVPPNTHLLSLEQLAIPGVTQASCYFKYFVRTIPRIIMAHSCRSVPGRSRPSGFGVPAAHLLQRVLTPSKQGQLAPRPGFLSIWYREEPPPTLIHQA